MEEIGLKQTWVPELVLPVLAVNLLDLLLVDSIVDVKERIHRRQGGAMWWM